MTSVPPEIEDTRGCSQDAAISVHPYDKLEFRLREQLTAWPGATDGGRHVAIKSVLATIAFIEEEPRLAGKDLTLLLRSLVTALFDLDDGVQPKMLAPQHRSTGRPPEETSALAVRARAAYIMDILIHLGCSEEDAAKKVDRVLRRCSIQVKQKKTTESSTWKAVREWRRGMDHIPDNDGALGEAELKKIRMDALIRRDLQKSLPVQSVKSESAALKLLEGLLKSFGPAF